MRIQETERNALVRRWLNSWSPSEATPQPFNRLYKGQWFRSAEMPELIYEMVALDSVRQIRVVSNERGEYVSVPIGDPVKSLQHDALVYGAPNLYVDPPLN